MENKSGKASSGKGRRVADSSKKTSSTNRTKKSIASQTDKVPYYGRGAKKATNTSTTSEATKMYKFSEEDLKKANNGREENRIHKNGLSKKSKKK